MPLSMWELIDDGNEGEDGEGNADSNLKFSELIRSPALLGLCKAMRTKV